MTLQWLRNARTVITSGSRRRTIDGLRTTFSVVKSDDLEANSVRMGLWNTAPETRSLFSGEKDVTIQLYAGYGNDLALLSEFDVTNVPGLADSGDPDKEFVIEGLDGLAGLQAIVSVSFSQGEPLVNVIDAVIKQTSLERSEVDTSFVNQKVLHGRSFTGSARVILQSIADTTGGIFSVNDNKLSFRPGGNPTAEKRAFFNKETGLIGTPTRKTFSVGDVDYSGWAITTLLRPKVLPGATIEVESKEFTGALLVRRITADGDTAEGPWYTMHEGVAV